MSDNTKLIIVIFIAITIGLNIGNLICLLDKVTIKEYEQMYGLVDDNREYYKGE